MIGPFDIYDDYWKRAAQSYIQEFYGLHDHIDNNSPYLDWDSIDEEDGIQEK